MKLIPVIVLVDEDVLPILDAQTVGHADLLAAFDDMRDANGWTNQMIYGGSLLADALRMVDQAEP